MALMGISGNEEGQTEDEAREMVLSLCRLASPLMPVAFCFDQIEALQTSKDDEESLFLFEEVKGQRHTGVKVVDGILAKSRERDGMISVFQLPEEMIQLLADLASSQVLYKDLTSDLTSLDRLIAGLKGRRHTGFIDVQLPGRHETATIFLREGDVLEATLSRHGTISDGRRSWMR